MSSSRNTLNQNFAASNSLIFTAKINKYVFAEYNTHMIISFNGICLLMVKSDKKQFHRYSNHMCEKLGELLQHKEAMLASISLYRDPSE